MEVKAYVGPSTIQRLHTDKHVLGHSDPSASQVEKSDFCRRVIQARIQDKLADPGVILDAITAESGSQLGEDIEGCLAGFPCQARSKCDQNDVLVPHFIPWPGSLPGGQPVFHAGDSHGASQRDFQNLGREKSNCSPVESRMTVILSMS